MQLRFAPENGPRRPTTPAVAGIALSLFCFLVPGCARPQQQPQGQAQLPPEVEVCRPVVRQVTDYEEFPGRLDAYRAVEVRARVSGFLQQVFFQEGAEVKEGDKLFEIDPRTYQADYDRSLANIALAEAHLARLSADFNRAKELLPRNAISKSDYDLALGDQREAEATLKVAEAARRVARLNLDFTVVTAPIGGRISRQMIDPGNMVKADETPLTTIVALDPVYAYFDINERTLLRIRRLIEAGKLSTDQENNTRVLLGLADETGFPHDGKVNFSDNRVDAMTGTLRLRGVFPNAKRLFSPGMFARIRLPIGDAHEALLLAEQAILSDQGQKFVYVVDGEGKASYRRIEVGSLHDGYRVIEDGLKQDERVVYSGVQKIRKGAKVKAKDVDPATASDSAPRTAAAESK